jgi:hypothetical protein
MFPYEPTNERNEEVLISAVTFSPSNDRCAYDPNSYVSSLVSSCIASAPSFTSSLLVNAGEL